MSLFPDTPQSLLRKIAELARGDDAAVWADFVECYLPAVHRFIELQYPMLPPEDREDAVQDVFIRLVNLLRSERYDSSKARFRTYLATLMRRVLIDRYRNELFHRRIEQTILDSPDKNGTVGRSVWDSGILLDIQWRQAVHQIALERLLDNSAISETTREVYRAYVLEERPLEEVAVQFHMTRNAVSQVKRRLDAALEAIERQLFE